MKDTGRARWLAGMITDISGYAREASVVLVRQANEIDHLRAQVEGLKSECSQWESITKLLWSKLRLTYQMHIADDCPQISAALRGEGE